MSETSKPMLFKVGDIVVGKKQSAKGLQHIFGKVLRITPSSFFSVGLLQSEKGKPTDELVTEPVKQGEKKRKKKRKSAQKVKSDKKLRQVKQVRIKPNGRCLKLKVTFEVYDQSATYNDDVKELLFDIGDIVVSRPFRPGCSYSHMFAKITNITKKGFTAKGLKSKKKETSRDILGTYGTVEPLLNDPDPGDSFPIDLEGYSGMCDGYFHKLDTNKTYTWMDHRGD